MQYRNKIIALFTVVCLLVGMMVVPSSAAGTTVCFYNDYFAPELPESISASYPYVTLTDVGWGSQIYFLYYSDVPFSAIPGFSSLRFTANGANVIAYTCYKGSDSYMYWDDRTVYSPLATTESAVSVLWTNYDLFYTTGGLALSGSDPFYFSLPFDPSVPDDPSFPSDPSLPANPSLPADPSVLDVLISIFSLLSDSNLKEGVILDSIGQLWLRLRYIEENTLSILDAISALAPSEQETALKETTSDVTAAYTETFWSDDGGGFGRSGIEDAGTIFQSSKKMFDTGVSVSDFFGLFDAYGWGNWFSAETRDDLDTVLKPSVIDDCGDSELSTYEKNLQEIQSFVGGG